MKAPRKLSNGQKIILKFVKGAKSNKDRLFWPKEMKIAKKLLEFFPIEFYEYIHQPDSPLDNEPSVYSLAWFLTENGKRFLNTQYIEYQKRHTPIKETIVLSTQNDKIGEDVPVQKKPQTLLDFLRYG